MPRRRSWTDDDLRTALAQSENLYQVSKHLGLTPGSRTYALLRRHITRLDLPSDHLPRREQRHLRRRTWTDDDLRGAVAASRSYSQVLRALGYEPNGGMHRYIRQKILTLGIDTSHLEGQSWRKGLRNVGVVPTPLSEILARNSTYMSSRDLRRRLIAAGLKPRHCERCGLDSWMGEPLPLALDHVNGEHTDNRLENLRILCPNCHALTETWCARNRGKSKSSPA